VARIERVGDDKPLIRRNAGGRATVRPLGGRQGEPGAPGGSDASFAGWVADTAPSLTRAALDAGYSPVATAVRHPLTAMYHADGYGAVGDGVADDTAAIQGAIDAASAAGGGVVYLADGAYKVDALTLPSKVSLRGNNRGAQAPAKCKLIYNGTVGGTVISPANRAANTINWGISGIAIDGGDLAAIGIELYRVSYSRGEDLLVYNIQPGGVGVLFDSAVSGATYFNVFDNCKVDEVSTGVRFQNGANANRWQGGAIVTCGTSMEFLSLSAGNLVLAADMENATVGHVHIDATANVFIGLHLENAPYGYNITANGGSTRRVGTTFATTVTSYVIDASATGGALDEITSDTYQLRINTLKILSKMLSSSTQVDFDPYPFSGTANVLMNFFRNFTTTGIRQWNIYHGDGTGVLAFRFDFGNTNLFIGDTSPGTSAKGCLAMANRITAPTGNPVGIVAYAESGALRVRTTAGTIQTVAGDVVAKSANYTATTADSVILGTGGVGGITITLPAAVQGSRYTVKKVDSGAGAVTIATTSSQVIDGATTKVLSAQWSYARVVSDGVAWFVIAAG